jgi:hypothetical protein
VLDLLLVLTERVVRTVAQQLLNLETYTESAISRSITHRSDCAHR